MRQFPDDFDDAFLVQSLRWPAPFGAGSVNTAADRIEWLVAKNYELRAELEKAKADYVRVMEALLTNDDA